MARDNGWRHADRRGESSLRIVWLVNRSSGPRRALSRAYGAACCALPGLLLIVLSACGQQAKSPAAARAQPQTVAETEEDARYSPEAAPIADVAELEASLRKISNETQDTEAFAPFLPPLEFDLLNPGESLAAPGSGLLSEADFHNAVLREISALRLDVERLNQKMESLLDMRVAYLEDENANLRDEIRRLYTLRFQEGVSTPEIPRPGTLNRDWGYSGYDLDASSGGGPTQEPQASPSQAQDTDGDAEADPDAGTEAPAQPSREPEPGFEPDGDVIAMGSHSGVQYAVIEEWGRTPEEARRFGEDVSSLKGMICAVPPDTSQDKLEALGRHFRKEFETFDNINIEVFGGAEAARHYARTNEKSGGNYLMQVTRHKASGRDLIMLVQGSTYSVITPGQEGSEPVAANEASQPSLENLPGLDTGKTIVIEPPGEALSGDPAETSGTAKTSDEEREGDSGGG